MTAFERITKLFNDAADMMVVSLFLIVLITGYLPGVQKRWSYACAAFAFGVAFPVATRAAGLNDGIALAACMLGVVCGPITAAALHGKTIFEALDEIRKSRAGRDSDEA